MKDACIIRCCLPVFSDKDTSARSEATVRSPFILLLIGGRHEQFVPITQNSQRLTRRRGKMSTVTPSLYRAWSGCPETGTSAAAANVWRHDAISADRSG